MITILRELLDLPGNTVTATILRGGRLEWTSLLKAKDGLKVSGSGQIELPPKPEEGKEESQPGEIARARTETGKAGLKGDVTAGLPSEHLLLRVIALPDVPDDELRSMVQLQVDKFSPFPIETTVVSHEVIERKDGKSLVLAAAVKEEIVQDIGTTLNALGLVPRRMDAEILGWQQLLSDAGQIHEKGRQVVLLMDANLPQVIVFQQGKPVLFRSLGESEGLSGDDFEIETARAVSYTLMSVEMEHGSDAYTIDVWHRGEAPRGLAEKLRNECSCEVALHSLDELPPVCEGLARRTAVPEGRLNLVPGTWQAKAGSALFRKRMIAAAVAAAGLWVLVLLGFFGGLLVEQKRLDLRKGEQARWRKQAKDVTDMRRRVLTIEHYMDTSHSVLECLREISERLPPGVLLTSFTYKKGEDLKISGEAGAVGEIYAFKTELDESKFFVSSALNNVHLEARRAKQVFDVDIKLPGGEL